jgi:ubiquinone/menaquinone biosynthesis C-methylase UbiE
LTAAGMNRKARRAGLKGRNVAGGAAAANAAGSAAATSDLMTKARWHHQQGQAGPAQDICNQILEREPGHVHALNLLGLILQASGRHRLAVKALAKAVASDQLNAACHYNLGSSYQALGQRAEAAFHFKRAIALGMSERNIEEIILKNPVIAACIGNIEEKWPLLAKVDELFEKSTVDTIANDIFLRGALESVPLRGAALERLFTLLRMALLAYAQNLESGRVDGAIARLVCAVAQQCFINEYVFAQSEEETRQSGQLKDLLLQKLAEGSEIPPLLLAEVASYMPLHSLPAAQAMLSRSWPGIVSDLVRQQLREPLEEAADRGSIPALTAVDDSVSLQVMQQYEENPYPRWTINPLAALREDREMQSEAAGALDGPGTDILIAGCGTGQHAFQVAQRLPKARVLAVDVSLPSLAYARRKTRAEGLQDIEYAQADILKLGTIGRSFDRIEAVGVLHHLAEPEAGWRVLLSLLRPGGEMRVGLYSETARRAVVEARAFIAQRGYRPTLEDIRTCRQEMLRDENRWKRLTVSADFYSASGCRDLLFNVMEHRFTIPRIATFLAEQELSFLGFEPEPGTMEAFQKRFPGDAARTNLDDWHAFETDNPQTFRYMYVFTVRKN